MAKKKTKKKKKQGQRINVSSYGIDFPKLLDEIRPHLTETNVEIAKRIDTSPAVVSHILTGVKSPSLGQLAALADASGGKLTVTFEPPAKLKRAR